MAMFKIRRLEDRIVLDGAGMLDLVDELDDQDFTGAMDGADGDAPDDADAGADDSGIDGTEPLFLADGEDVGADEGVHVLVISSDLQQADDLAAAAKDGVIVVEYDPAETDVEGLANLIHESLGGQEADSIAFATHNEGASLPLAEGAVTNLDSLETDTEVQSFWKAVGGELSDGGRIDLLACNVVEDESGEAFVAKLEDISGANVAASVDATGNEAYGGDWVLETDDIDLQKTYFDADALDDVEGTLAVPVLQNPMDDRTYNVGAVNESFKIVGAGFPSTVNHTFYDSDADTLFYYVGYSTTASWLTFDSQGTTTGTFNVGTIPTGDLGKTITVTVEAWSPDWSGYARDYFDVSVVADNAILIDPVGGDNQTGEDGDTAEFNVSLQNNPGAEVTVTLGTNDAGEGTVTAGGTLTFSSTNYGTPQTVTVTGVDDSIVDGNQNYQLTASASSSGYYNGATATENVVNVDDDTFSVLIGTTGDELTSENLDTASFTVSLGAQPTAQVQVNLSSNDASEGKVISTKPIYFSAANWDDPQTVTVQGVNDASLDGDVVYRVAAQAYGGGYNGQIGRATFTNIDNDQAGFVVTPSDMETTEDGGLGKFYVHLKVKPNTSITVNTASDDTGEGDVTGGGTLTFDSSNWDQPRLVTITGQDDAVVDGDQTYTVTLQGTGGAYDGLTKTALLTNVDNDSVGIAISGSADLETSEAGGTAEFDVVLLSQPTGSENVTVSFTSSDTGEGQEPASVEFTSANWDTAQTITVTGADDGLVDGDQPFTITATANGANYSGQNDSIGMTNVDDDTFGITVTPGTDTDTDETGDTASFSVVLKAQPTADVTVTLNSSDTEEGTVPASITFSSTNWDTARTVTVTGADDDIVDGDQPFTVTATANNGGYSGETGTATFTNVDDDTIAINITQAADTTTDEDGDTATFDVALNSQPTAQVTIDFSSSKPAEGDVSSGSLTFTTGNWDTPQTVTVTGEDDPVIDGSQKYTIIATGSGAEYTGVNATANFTNLDNDTAGLIFDTAGPLVTSEDGDTVSFTVRLATQPTYEVTVTMASQNTAEGKVTTGGSLTFTTGDWDVTQTVVVTGQDDSPAALDGDVAYFVKATANSLVDTSYQFTDGLDFTNLDNDGPSISVNTVVWDTSEDGETGSFTVVLNAAPTDTVTVTVTSQDTTEGTVGASTLSFTTENWSQAQTVIVTGVDDILVDPDVTYTVEAVANGGGYSGQSGAAEFTNADNDTPQILANLLNNVTTEAGATAEIEVVLSNQPTGEVEVSVISGDPLEGSPSTSTLTFDPSNFNSAQYVTITGQDDLVVDGDTTYPINFTATGGGYDGASLETIGAYGGVTDSAVLLNEDNDEPTIVVTVTDPTSTEDGGTGTIQAKLGAKPTGPVTVTVSIDDTTEGTNLSATTLTFTATNWNQNQPVTVEGKDDTILDGDVTYSVSFSAADNGYDGITASGVLTNTDNDTPKIGFTLDDTITSEDLDTGGFSIVLKTQPTGDVLLTANVDDTTEGFVSSSLPITFSSTTWDQPQLVTVTGQGDGVGDGDIAYNVIYELSGSGYDGITGSVGMTNIDEDNPGITFVALDAETSEAGDTGNFWVKLDAMPTDDVVVTVSSDEPGEGSVTGGAVLTFTTSNFDTYQTVTVEGVDDDVDDGDVTYTITAVPAGGGYHAGFSESQTLTNVDDDTAEILVSQGADISTGEGGDQATFTVSLASQPTQAVDVTVTSDDTGEGSVTTGGALRFSISNWSAPQTVVVTGQEDTVIDGDATYSVSVEATAGDPNYVGLTGEATLTNVDNDVPSLVVTTTDNLTREDGETGEVEVKLGAQPIGQVTVTISSDDTSEGLVTAGGSLTFESTNWNVGQTATITGQDDNMVDGDITYTVTFEASGSGYANVTASETLTNVDSGEAVGFITSAGDFSTGEDGATGGFDIKLSSQPTGTGTVTLTVSSGDSGEGSVTAGSTLSFSSTNWDVTQHVTVTGQDDPSLDGNQTYEISVTASGADYDGETWTTVMTNADDDVAELAVTRTDGITDEDGDTGAIDVALKAQPTGNVYVSLSSDTPTEGSVAGTGILTFSTGNWSVPQTATVNGVDDDALDGDATYTVTLTPSSGGYGSAPTEGVVMTNEDTDQPSLVVVGVDTDTDEDNDTGEIQVSLAVEPTGAVTVTADITDTTEGSVNAPVTLSFSPTNWDETQAITVEGVDDTALDGDVTYDVSFTAAGGGYDTATATQIMTNADNDSPQLVIDGVTDYTTLSYTTSETGDTDGFDIELNVQPTAQVTVTVGTSDSSEGLISSAETFKFSTTNWNVAQTAKVLGADDNAVDGDVPYDITVTAAGGGFGGSSAVLDFTNTDDDEGSVILTDISPVDRLTGEDGDTAAFEVTLAAQPVGGDVTVTLASDDTGEGTVDPASQTLTFTSSNWNQPQVVTVNGVDDQVDDGDQAYNVTATANGGGYVDESASITLDNVDDDEAGYVVTRFDELTGEDGDTGGFQLWLKTEPTAGLSVNISVIGDEGTTVVSYDSLAFSPLNWSDPQTVIIEGVDDDLVDGDQTYTVSLTGYQAGGLTKYDGLTDGVTLTNEDDDSYGVTVIQGTDPADVTTTEDGGDNNIRIHLNAEPTGTVQVSVTVDDTTEGLIGSTTGDQEITIDFDSSNWSQAQTVTIYGQDDAAVDGDVTYTVSVVANGGGYTGETGMATLTNVDNDEYGMTVITAGMDLVTGEDGDTGSFKVVLDAKPTGDVTVSFTSSDTEEGVAPADITFSTTNWNVARTVTVVGGDDDVADGSATFSITATANGGGYTGIETGVVTMDNLDDDAPGIVTSLLDATTDEDGATGAFQVALKSQPTATVSVLVSSDTPTEGQVTDGASLSFGTANWSAPQTVTVTGQPDDVLDGDVTYKVTAEAQAGGGYDTTHQAVMIMTNVDTDEPSLVVNVVDGTSGEDGDTAEVEVSLGIQPAGAVTVTADIVDTTEGAITGSATLNFDSGNWSQPQSFVIEGVDDDYADGDTTYTIGLSATGSDFDGITDERTLTNAEDGDSVGFFITETDTSTGEDLDTATFDIRLATKPTEDVTVTLSSSDTSEGKVTSTKTLIFTTGNWTEVQSVTVTGQDDDILDGSQTYTINISAAGGDYDGYTDGVDMTNTDYDTPDIGLTAVDKLTGEDGDTGSVQVVLKAQPTSTTFVKLTSDDTGEGANPGTIEFSTANWSQIQTVTINGVDDDVDDGDATYNITAEAQGGGYTGENKTVVMTNVDDDTAAVFMTATDALTGEDGATGAVDIRLGSDPGTNTVTISISSSDTEEGTVTGGNTIDFTSANWSTIQTVVIDGVDDDVDDGNQTYTITATAGANYGNLTDTGDFTNVDDDEAGINIVVNTNTGNVTDEDGATIELLVTLNSEPTANVTVTVASDDATEGKAETGTSPGDDELTFSPTNWSDGQTVLVTGQNDDLLDGDVTYSIIATGSGSAEYVGVTASAEATNLDNDVAAIYMTATTATTNEDGTTGEVQIALSAKPNANVTVTLASSDTSEGEPNRTSLTFSASNWNVARAVQINPVDDDVVDGDITYNITASATGGGFNGATGSALMTNGDDDTAALILITDLDNVTGEDGDTGAIQIRLGSEPTKTVNVSIASDDTSEGRPDSGSIQFTTGNWDVTQLVTFTGVDDSPPAFDDDQSYKYTVTAASFDPVYDGLCETGIMTNVDDDELELIITPTGDSETGEDGDTATFSVRLNGQPTVAHQVTVGFINNYPDEGTVATGTTLTFDSSNWSVGQTVEVTGIDDSALDGDVTYTVTASGTATWDGTLNPTANAVLTNVDDDLPTLIISGAEDFSTGEDGATGGFTIKLASEPTAPVQVTIASQDTSEGKVTIATQTLNFPVADWDVTQAVVINGQDDQALDGNQTYSLLITATGDGYAGVTQEVVMTNVDDDSAEIVITMIDSTTSEAGDTGAFTVALSSQPTATVEVTVASEDTAEGSVTAGSTLYFSTANWDVTQAVTVTGLNDADGDGDIAYRVTATADLGGFTGATAAADMTNVDLNVEPEAPFYVFYIKDDAAIDDEPMLDPNGVFSDPADGKVIFTDPDTGTTPVYSITDGNDDNIFAIDTDTGLITVADPTDLQYELQTTYTLTVEYSDDNTAEGGPATGETLVQINVIDAGVNDYTPPGTIDDQLIESDSLWIYQIEDGTFLDAEVVLFEASGTPITEGWLSFEMETQTFLYMPDAGSDAGYLADDTFVIEVTAHYWGGNYQELGTATLNFNLEYDYIAMMDTDLLDAVRSLDETDGDYEIPVEGDGVLIQDVMVARAFTGAPTAAPAPEMVDAETLEALALLEGAEFAAAAPADAAQAVDRQVGDNVANA